MKEQLILRNHIKDVRSEKKLSQSQLAELVGVSRNTISSIETGQFNPTAKLALILCIALDKKFEELFYFLPLRFCFSHCTGGGPAAQRSLLTLLHLGSLICQDNLLPLIPGRKLHSQIPFSPQAFQEGRDGMADSDSPAFPPALPLLLPLLLPPQILTENFLTNQMYPI